MVFFGLVVCVFAFVWWLRAQPVLKKRLRRVAGVEVSLEE
jgi:hypothetical protein